MKIKRMVSALALAAGLAISVPSLASTFGLSSQTMTSVQAADGWQRDDGGVFYLQNDTRVTGLKDIDGATYYFDATAIASPGQSSWTNTPTTSIRKAESSARATQDCTGSATTPTTITSF